MTDLDFASILRQGENDCASDCFKISEAGHCTCFVVSDGRETPGGAQLCVESIITDFEDSGAITKSSIPDFLKNAHQKLSSAELMPKASAAVLLTDGDAAVWGNIGDCRIYQLRDNLLYEITPDNSEAYALYEAGKIRYPKIRKNALRHRLTKQLGGECGPDENFSQPQKLRPGDSMLICTDGFWGSIHERQIEKTLKKSTSAQNWLDNMLKIVEKNIKHQKYSRFRDSFCAITIKL
ncbi:MAG: protein phosphatase 2C domain-containing protein [Eubacteriales bacterium]|nr:protein phosphatase 2C domain-containing protein [Clostridiales bacterium]MDD6916300.1 protein phosphatase 2C domain-containing protein [Eubacteriales bacterium]MDY4212245.1 protein phosphatase 2C domain-containing protein [Eubacteriales bacterium]MDY5229857.1 protein phosphatase 2C domain-containing protein [Eubacteriales bacterium]